MRQKKHYNRWIVSICVAVLVAGCGSNEPRKGATNSNETAAATATSSSGGAISGSGETQVTPAAAVLPSKIVSPAVVKFDKMAVTLDEASKQYVAQIAFQARSAKKVIATGYCDRAQIGNPADAAAARAVAVRDELIRQGMLATSIQIKVVTNVPKKHAVEVRFN